MSKNQKSVKLISTKSEAEKYDKKTPREHVLIRPDTYIGDIEPTVEPMWIYSTDNSKMLKEEITYTPGFFKVFDELLVNARDASETDKTCDTIKVDYNVEQGYISVWNNGDIGIPVEEHPKHKMLVPTMIFGELLTSSNYNDNEERTTGGRNGYGSKCIALHTKIPLWNGEIKFASQIIINDKLIGDDGTIRTVNQIITGKGKMFDIIQENGDTYTVNDQHILTMHMPSHKVISWSNEQNGWIVKWWDDSIKQIITKICKVEIPQNLYKNKKRKFTSIEEENIENNTQITNAKIQLENFCKRIPDNNIFDISIEDFMKLDKTTKRNLAGLRGEYVQWEKKNVNMDPYLLGYYICNKNLNPTIPLEYLVNDRNTRLEVLAGIIDTFGFVSHDGTKILISQDYEYKKYVNEIIYLSRSLGFFCKLETVKSTWAKLYNHKVRITFNINISGDIANIPIRLNKCRIINRINKSRSTGFIEIKESNCNEYIGFQIDGNQRFVINDFTVTHNCANIFATKFIVEIDDAKRKKRFIQEWSDNMSVVSQPSITKLPEKTKSSVKITFYPDFARFKIKDLANDHKMLFHRRTFDIAGTSNSKLKVFFNETKINTNNFKSYIELYYPTESNELYFDNADERWTVGVFYKPDAGGEIVSFVNGINTYRGGTHCTHVIDNLIKVLINDYIKKKDKNIKVTPALLKENLIFFINSVIINPAFGSQTKDTLSSKIDKFGSKYEPTQVFLKKLAKCGIVEQVIELAKFKENAGLKKTDGKKQVKISGIPKLEDANKAGTKESGKCTLILTEGDSAKATAMAGLGIVGRDYYGVFPLKGKLLNVREAGAAQLLANEEIKNLKMIIGLKQGEDYSLEEKFNTLRYGHVLLLTDQDSVTGDTPLLLKNNNDLIEIRTIDDISHDWLKRENKEVSLTNYKIWSDNGWTNIKEVIRHKVTKKIYRVLTHTGVVDVTEDHSLINSLGNEITPSDCKVGDKLLHSFPNFFDIKYNYSDIEKMNTYDIQQIATQLEIQYLNKKNKEQLLKEIKSIITNYDFNITQEEAYKMGLFWADSSYEIKSKENIFYDKDKNKKIPVEILNSSKIIKEEFFKGYYDGYYSNSKELKVNSQCNLFEIDSKIGAHCMYLLCKSIGYNVTINLNSNNSTIYTLNVTKENLQIDPIAIINIIDIGTTEQYVYDLETENHHFQAGIGKLIVHNTDGTHIKGLFINMLHTLWPSLIKRESFVQSLNTPIVKASKGKEVIIFYNLSDYEKWKEKSESSSYKVKYYKGLGTSTSQEAKEYFIDIEEKLLNYLWENIDADIKAKFSDSDKQIIGKKVVTCKKTVTCIKPIEPIKKTKSNSNSNKESDEESDEKSVEESVEESDEENSIGNDEDIFIPKHDDDDAIRLAFDKTRADDRKKWLMSYDKNKVLTYDQKVIPFYDFIHYDLIHFSNEDLYRSIPSVVDGLKPSQRKILYGAYLRGLDKTEVKVAQLAGFVSDKAAYHHGEMSLNGAIVGMAQNFVGSNNINILFPAGQFGTRLKGGSDAASSRYIWTSLEKITPLIYNPVDNPILKQQDEDGEPIEPEYYAPIIPMVLVNGAAGIGTGFSTKIPPYNPVDIIKNIRNIMIDAEFEPMNPWWQGFEGIVSKIDEFNYEIYGTWSINDNKLLITELPVGEWSSNYKEFLEKILDDVPLRGKVDDKKVKKGPKKENPFISYKDNNTDSKVHFELTFEDGYLQNAKDIDKQFHLYKKYSIANMHLYGPEGHIKHYDTVEEIMRDYFNVRLDLYQVRKEYQLAILEHQLKLISYKVKFILMVVKKELQINNKKRSEIEEKLEENKFPKIGRSKDDTKISYDYLLSMPIYSLTQEKIEELKNQQENKEAEYDELNDKTPKDIWLSELDVLEAEYTKWYDKKLKEAKENIIKKKSKKSKNKIN